ncbi:MAG: pentapeptide repeat-containing protein, partial [Proteobacteria bacterium]|nr:pentapeptide repeat-containing protein [Pseudomonadota bacterium]
MDLPEDEESEDFKRINGLKEEKVKEKKREGDFNFQGAKLSEVDFSRMTIEGSLDFSYAVIRNDARFYEAKIGEILFFEGAKIGGSLSFEGTKIAADALFSKAKIGGSAWFDRAEIRGNAHFSGVEIGGSASFRVAEIEGYAWFDEVTIGGSASFLKAKMGGSACFDGAKIEGEAEFTITEIKWACSFKDAEFKYPKAQQEACRTARKTQERIGDRVLADYHFYREMEAKRKLKHPIIRVLELPVQYIFGYGVHPLWVITTWLLAVICLALVYWMGNGVVAADSFLEYFYFSVVTAA